MVDREEAVELESMRASKQLEKAELADKKQLAMQAARAEADTNDSQVEELKAELAKVKLDRMREKAMSAAEAGNHGKELEIEAKEKAEIDAIKAALKKQKENLNRRAKLAKRRERNAGAKQRHLDGLEKVRANPSKS